MTCVNLLWTGGWDSTFRLIELLSTRCSSIQPWYVVDNKRPSFVKEIDAMATIYKNLSYKLEVFDRVFTPKFVPLQSIKKDPCLREDFKKVKENVWVGEQYLWLAEFAQQHGFENLEIGWPEHKEVPPVYKYCFKNVINAPYDYTLVNDHEVQHLFGRFSFPLITRKKEGFMSLAKEYKHEDIMLMTWFCHKPVLGKPCGSCSPCEQAKEQGRPLGTTSLWPLVKIKRHYGPKFRKLLNAR